jgi:hypothetical protein
VGLEEWGAWSCGVWPFEMSRSNLPWLKTLGFCLFNRQHDLVHTPLTLATDPDAAGAARSVQPMVRSGRNCDD